MKYRVEKKQRHRWQREMRVLLKQKRGNHGWIYLRNVIALYSPAYGVVVRGENLEGSILMLGEMPVRTKEIRG